jgi:hypothetical protein
MLKIQIYLTFRFNCPKADEEGSQYEWILMLSDEKITTSESLSTSNIIVMHFTRERSPDELEVSLLDQQIKDSGRKADLSHNYVRWEKHAWKAEPIFHLNASLEHRSPIRLTNVVRIWIASHCCYHL